VRLELSLRVCIILNKGMEVRKIIYRIGKILPKSWTDSRQLFALFVKPQQLKMLVLDLDGTTLNDQKEMIPENITAIKNLRRKNPEMIVCVATGRTFHESVRFAQKIEADFLLTNNGSAFYQRVGTKYELGKAFTLSEQQYQTIYNYIRKYESENSDLAWRIVDLHINWV
jgi:ribonucleotide monophosphatase NagD (HAD superfamily)